MTPPMPLSDKELIDIAMRIHLGKASNDDARRLMDHIRSLEIKLAPEQFDGTACRECGTCEKTSRGWCARHYVENKL